MTPWLPCPMNTAIRAFVPPLFKFWSVKIRFRRKRCAVTSKCQPLRFSTKFLARRSSGSGAASSFSAFFPLFSLGPPIKRMVFLSSVEVFRLFCTAQRSSAGQSSQSPSNLTSLPPRSLLLPMSTKFRNRLFLS